MMLELQNIHKVFNEGTVDEAVLFRDFNFAVQEGEFVSVIGSNGSGKTTMLNLICGADRAVQPFCGPGEPFCLPCTAALQRARRRRTAGTGQCPDGTGQELPR